MSSYLQFAILGLGAAAAYTLLAQGLVLIYRASGVINFAQGAFAMVGAYTFYEFHTKSGIPIALAALLTLVVGGLLGVLSYLLVMRPLRHAAPLSRVIASLGILAILQSAAILRYKDSIINVNSILPVSPVHLLSTTVPSDRFWMLGIAIAVTAALWLVSGHTRAGLATYAVAENEQAVAALGWSTDLIATVNWAAGAVLAAAAGIVISPLVGLQVGVLILLLIPTLAVTLLGQFESFWLTFAGALFIAIAQSELIGHVSQPWMPDVVPFAVIVIVMVVRGRALPLRHQIAERPPRVGSGRIIWPAAGAAVVLGVVANLTLPTNWVGDFIVTEAFALLILSIVVLTGYAGQLSLAQFSIAGIAALVAGRLVASQGWQLLPAGLAGVVAAAAAGMIFAMPALRQRGVNLAVVTAGLGAAIYSALFSNSSLTGGEQGLTVGPQKLFGIDLDPLLYPRRYALLVELLLVVLCLAVCRLRRSPGGRRLIAVRLNERAAAALGVNVASAKIFAFGVSAVIAGVGGVLLAFRNYTILYNGFDPMSSVTLVTLAVVGGVGFVTGSVFGALLAVGGIGTLISQGIVGQNANNWLALVGGVFVILILVQDPDGLASQYSRGIRRLLQRVRRSPGTSVVDELKTGDAEREFSTGRTPQQLTVEDLRVRFGGVVAVNGASIEVNPGEIVGLIGPNGAGKTTLIDAVTGFVRPESGTIKLAGETISDWLAFRRSRAGLVRSFQSLELFDELTVYENLLTSSDPQDARTYVTGMLVRRDRALPERVLTAVRALGLEDDLGRRADELSYGRRRLLAIARSIASDPTVLLLDEPAAGLDATATDHLGEVLRDIVTMTGLGILLIEHEMPLVMKVCDRLVVLDYGSVIATGTPAEIQANPLVIDAYLGDVGLSGEPSHSATSDPAAHGAH